MAQLQKIIKVTQEQYEILQSGGTVGSYTGINANYIYLVEDSGESGSYDDTEIRQLIADEEERAKNQENILSQKIDGTTEIANAAQSGVNNFSQFIQYAEESYAQKSQLPTFTLNGTVLTITDNN